MIILYHNGATVVELANTDAFGIDKLSFKTIASVLVEVAKKYPKEILVWCHQSLKEQLNISEIEKVLHHKKIILSYNPSNTSYLDSAIGYVDTSLFVQINNTVTFPTWQISSAVGCVYAEVLLALNEEIPLNKNFDYFLCSLGKLMMPKGLLCYSEPKLLQQNIKNSLIKSSQYTLFRFVKQHYKLRWVFLLMFNLFLYQRKFPFLPFLFSLFYKNRSKNKISLEGIDVQSTNKVIDKATVDVIIPTIGRKKYLYDVLKDLKVQTHLPSNVIIVEQNPDEGSESELDYLINEDWPFAIKHTFTHQAGACNARNIALGQVTSEWVFFADDDIRFANFLIQKTFEKINSLGTKAVTLRCFQEGQNKPLTSIFQWVTFGSGCSFVFTECLQNCKFEIGYEFGFGEDGDFGMQLRNNGYDILYLPEPEILHLKAPVGGFRTKPVLRWHKDAIQPKPSPTIMLYEILHNTIAQTKSFKTTLFIKYYRLQKIKNPFKYYINFQKQWERSVFWANKLKQQNEI